MRRRMNKQRAFTLIELMVVVAIIGVLATMAMLSFTSGASQRAVDTWTAQNRDAILTASRRAIATRTPFMVVMTPTTVQWCQVIGTPPAYTGAATVCPVTEVAGYEYGRVIEAGSHGATSPQWYGATDVAAYDGTYVTPSRVVMGSVTLYAGKNGVISTNLADAVTAGGLPDPTKATGFTLYTTARNNDNSNPKQFSKRLVVYGLTGKTRIFEDH